MSDQDPQRSPPGAHARPSDDQIRPPDNIFRGVLFPIFTLLIVFAVLLKVTPQIANCEDYFFVKLIYPFLFGALGAVLGGTLVVEGMIPLLGEKSRMRAAGGIAGAVLGFAIAQFSQPSECEAKAAIILKGFPVSGLINSSSNAGTIKRAYIGLYDTTSSSVTTSVERTNDSATRDLKFRFSARDRSKDGFKVALQFYRSVLDGNERFEFAWSCTISAKIEAPPETGFDKYQLMESEPLRYEVDFNPNFFAEVEEARKKGTSEVACFKGRSRLNGAGPSIDAQVAAPLYVSRLKGYFGQELWHVVQTSSPLTEKSAAQQPEAVNGELSVGEKAQPGAASPLPKNPTSLSTPSAPPRFVAGCGATAAQRAILDTFISGDDLDTNRRKELYSQWRDFHCYVWPLVKKGETALERSRALKLTANAIINNSLEANPTYWQPSGPNRRDFTKPLPMLVEADYRTVFELLKSDDLPVRNEATRFIRNLPVDKFERLFVEQSGKLDQLTSTQRERIAIAASFMYYGRIVEWLDPPKEEASKVIAVTGSDFKAALKWTDKTNLAESAKAYEAMLWYAKAIVERETLKNEDLARNSFRSVLDLMSLTLEPYPSNPLHLAQAVVAVTLSGDAGLVQQAFQEIRGSETYSSSTPLNYPNAPKSIALNSAPGDQFKRTPAKNLVNANEARMLLRKGDWVFVQYRDQLGWIKRETRVAGPL